MANENETVTENATENATGTEVKPKIPRWKNKAFWVAFVPLTVSMIYQECALFGVVPPIAQDSVTNQLIQLVNLLGLLGIFMNPTTDGFAD
jgi:phi LC3 family holin